MTNNTRRELGQIEKRGDRYRARIAVGTKADGTRRTMSKTFATREDAKAWLLAQAVEMGKCPDLSAGLTLKDDLWPAFKVARESTLSKRTMKDYTWAHEKYWIPLLGTRDVTLITPAIVQRELNKMTHDNAKHAKAALSAVLTWAARSDLIQVNPLKGHTFEYPEKTQSVDVNDDDPFAAIESTRDVWTVTDVLKCFDLIRGLPLKPAWLMCVGGGLRVEEALAIRPMDVRRIDVGGREVTQLAVSAARTQEEKRKVTKTKQGVRIVGMVEPMGERLWEIAQGCEKRKEPICEISAHRQNKAWRNYFMPPSISKHAPKSTTYRGKLQELPYTPLSKMRNTHVTMMAEAGVSDSLNALYHGHTESVERRHYLKPDMTAAAAKVSDHLKLVM